METKTIRMKIDTQNFFNKIISGLNKVVDMLQVQYDPEDNPFGRELPRDLQYVDTGLKILADYVNDISKRALELKDPVLIKLLMDIHAISPEEVEDETLRA
jgi:hypothetical protein